MQHFLQFCQIIRVKPVFGAPHDEMQIRIADVIVIQILLGRAQTIFPLVGVGLETLHIAFLTSELILYAALGVERFIIWLNCAIVGSPSAIMTSIQKDSTVVKVASRSSKRLKICL